MTPPSGITPTGVVESYLIQAGSAAISVGDFVSWVNDSSIYNYKFNKNVINLSEI